MEHQTRVRAHLALCDFLETCISASHCVACPISWIENDHALEFSLLNVIEDSEEIKAALFPPKGANQSTSKGGGKRKTEFHWQICQLLFEGHTKYGLAFALVDGKKQQSVWGTKIKNHLKM